MTPQAAFLARVGILGIPQPPTAGVGGAAIESNANIGVGNTQSATTRWFVAMFSGFANAGNIYVTPAGFDGFPETKAIHANAIIKFERDGQKAHSTTCNRQFDCNCPLAENCFWDAFRRVASDPVGRVLLYRILLEIVRPGEGADAIAVSLGGVSPLPLVPRNSIKILRISYSQNPDDAVFYRSGRMKFSNRPTSGRQLLKRLHPGGINYEICKKEDIIANIVEATIFHEFLHWFHMLRCQIRQNNYSVGRPAAAAGAPSFSIVAHSVTAAMFAMHAAIYAPPIAPALQVQLDNSKSPWGNGNGQCHFEEILTILGRDVVIGGPEYLIGDDLSENAYRISCNLRGKTLPHVCGHSDFMFLEDAAVLVYSTNVADNCVQSIIIPIPVVPLAPAAAALISPNVRFQTTSYFSGAGFEGIPNNAGVGNSFFP
jgi:hypothetical protein